MKTRLLLLVFTFFAIVSAYAQTAINTSFESTDGYASASTIAGTNKWTGQGAITTQSAAVRTGAQALQLSSTASSLQTDHIAYTKSETGLTGDVYLDLWIKVQALNGEFTVATYDLTPNSSSKRCMVFSLTSAGQIKVFNGSSGSNEQAYTVGEWFRFSAKIDYALGTYQVAINGVLVNKTYNFRESYTPSTLGRPSGALEYHSLRFSNGTATNSIAIDDVYVGTSPIADVTFGSSSTSRTITVTQPAKGTISLSPQKETYELGDQVTANITVPTHYLFTGWTGDLSGTETSKTFAVTKNMTIGANVSVDPANPPASYTINLQQPAAGGTITLEPLQDTYYEGTQVKASVSLHIGYQFNGWTGSISGSQTPTTFTITGNMSVGADVTETTAAGTIKEVSTAKALKDALAALLPGDEIIVADGDYNLGGVSIKNLGGTASKPVVVRAKNTGKVRFTGKSYFTLTGCENITFQGFQFDIEHVSTIFKLEGSSYIRITQNEFRMATGGTDTSKWIILGEIWANDICRSRYNRIDHNLFEGKYDGGAWIVIDGSHGTVPDISKYDRIDHNHFRLNTPRAANEKETIRLGVSDLSMKSSYCTVEYNLFEECDGDPEIVSVKSCDNIIRGNTFRKSLGTLSLRHGFRNRAEGNYFFGEGKTDEDGNGCGGVRVYGLDHVVVNNYFEGLTGSKWDAAITLTNGDVTNSSSSLTSHFLPENVIVAFNTMVNNASNIEIGFDNNGKYGKAPKNCLIAHNIVVDDANPIIKSYSTASLAGVSFLNNLMYPTGTSTIGIAYTESEIKVADPKLTKTNGRTPGNTTNVTPTETYKLSAESPAKDAAVGTFSYLTLDSEGQNRTGVFDIGADEYNTADPIVCGVLGAAHVGIGGTMDDYESPSTSVSHPAPDVFQLPAEGKVVQVSLVAMSGRVVCSGADVQTCLGSLAPGVYCLRAMDVEGNQYQTKIVKQ